MKKLFAYLAVFGMMSFSSYVYAQDEVAETDSAKVEEVAPAAEEAPAEAAPAAVEEVSVHKMLKTKFIEGGVEWMLPVLACIILGLAVAIERIIYLSAANTNTKKLLKKVEEARKKGGVEGIEAAKDVCRNTRGPVASIFYQGLDRYDEGLDNVEKAVVSYGSVQMGLLESGLPWLALFIALSPSYADVPESGRMHPTSIESPSNSVALSAGVVAQATSKNTMQMLIIIAITFFIFSHLILTNT